MQESGAGLYESGSHAASQYGTNSLDDEAAIGQVAEVLIVVTAELDRIKVFELSLQKVGQLGDARAALIRDGEDGCVFQARCRLQ